MRKIEQIQFNILLYYTTFLHFHPLEVKFKFGISELSCSLDTIYSNTLILTNKTLREVKCFPEAVKSVKDYQNRSILIFISYSYGQKIFV